MDPNHSKLEKLAAAYVRSRQLNARPSDIAKAVRSLRDHIDRGELTFDAVVSRLQLEIGSGLARKPTAFGDLARAVRDLDGGRLSTSERRFVIDMVSRGFAFRPSHKQSAWLHALFERLSRRAAA